MVKDRTMIALAALGISGFIQGLCVWGIINGVDGLLVGIFAGASNIAATVVGYYFGKEATT